MLAAIGAFAIAALLIAILTNRLSPVVALILIPVLAALAGGFGLSTAKLMLDGISAIAPVAGMFVFAILFFGIMTDAGMLAPIVNTVIRTVGTRPSLIVPGTTLLALLIHLDGSGAVCFLVVIPAMLPLYDKLHMDRRILACAASMAAGVNFLPWTGPTLRASAALKIPVLDIFKPMTGVQLVGIAFVFIVSIWLGRKEEKRLNALGVTSEMTKPQAAEPAPDLSLRRPRLFWFNIFLTFITIGVMISGQVVPVIVFMIATALALVINYPNASDQRARIDAHARAALLMASVLFAAGAFTGIMSGSGMLKAMAEATVAAVPAGSGQHIPFALALVSMPLSMLFDPDSFYFGVLPILAHTVGTLGGTALQTAQAALLGQMTLGFPVSPLTPATFLVAGLCRLELSAHQRFTFPFLFAASLVMTIAAVLFGLFPV
jgi:CitMHS family citrate-Mg2+:H+ or citrate-Ca2+:H+ symporter